MPRFTRINVLKTIYETGFIPIFYNSNAETAKNIASSCNAGGAKTIEFTNRGDHAIDIFTELEKYCRAELPDLILGAGTIMDPYTASLFIAHGANFIVGPNLNPEVAKLCNQHKIAYIPGCGSVSEITLAEELGCEIVKIFPAKELGGPPFVKAVLGPCPWTSIMAAGGVDCSEESLREWFDAGAACVALGSNLISREIIEKCDFEGLTERVAKVTTLIAKIRSAK